MSALSTVLILLQGVVASAFFVWAQGTGRNFGFHTPWLLLLLLPVLAYVALEIAGRRTPMLSFSYTGFAGGLPQSLPEALRPAVLFSAGLGLAFVIMAAARPQSEDAAGNDYSEGIDIIFALDISGSMEAADFKPNNRMFVAKEVLAEVIQERKSDRIGLVVFAGEAYTQVPLTLDYNVIVNLLQDVRTGVIQDGTAIGDALGTAVNRLREQTSKTRVIILLTDGDNNAGSLPPLEAATIAQELGIQIYTILIGKDGPVPFPAGRDIFGKIAYRDVNVPINPALLEEIAKKTNALYFRAEDRDALRRTLRSALDHQEKTRFEEAGTAPRRELFIPFLLFGLALVLLERVLRWTRFAEAFE
ncbi:MAG: VWA domain-containing protein [Deltaproteobacteria bacterium]|nr:VWA domain-containing protein [Deltaproteobacteria bacterium]